MGSRRRKRELETALLMAEVRLACLLVDHRDDPRLRRLLVRQRDKLVDLRLRAQGDGAGGRGFRIRSTLRRLLPARAFGRAY